MFSPLVLRMEVFGYLIAEWPLITLSSGSIPNIPPGCKTSDGIQRLAVSSSRLGEIVSFPSACRSKPRHSLDGEVKLWDLRGSTSSLKTWNLLPNGISAFDVHPHTHVFAAYVYVRSSVV